MALVDQTEDPRLTRARQRRQSYLLNGSVEHSVQQYKDSMFTPTPQEEAGRRLNNTGGNAGTDFLHKAGEGATFGATPYMAGIGAAIALGGRGYTGARDAERQRLSDLQTLDPVASEAAKFAGMAAVSPALEMVPGLKGLRGAGEHLVSKGVASSAARGVGARIAGRAAENMVVGGAMSGATGALEDPGTPMEKIKAGVRAIPAGEVGGLVLGGGLAAGGEVAGAAMAPMRRARADAATREASIWKTMPLVADKGFDPAADEAARATRMSTSMDRAATDLGTAARIADEDVTLDRVADQRATAATGRAADRRASQRQADVYARQMDRETPPPPPRRPMAYPERPVPEPVRMRPEPKPLEITPNPKASAAFRRPPPVSAPEPIAHEAEDFARGQLGEERVPFREIPPPQRAPKPKAPKQPVIPSVAAPDAPPNEVLPPKVEAPAAPKATPAPDPLAGLSPRLRDRLKPALEAQTEGELFTAASELHGAGLSPSENATVTKLLEERRKTLPKRTEAPVAPANTVGEANTPAPLSSAEDKALAEVKRQQRLASEQGRRLTAEETVDHYEAALKAEQQIRGGAGEAAPEPPFPVETPVAEAVQESASTPVVEAEPASVTKPVTAESTVAEAKPAEAPAVPQEPRKPLEGPKGASTDVRFADGGKSPARYRVVEAESLTPSHNPETWQPRADYPANVQQRQYHLDKTAQQQFEGRLAKYDPSEALDLTNNVTAGPATVTPDGIAVAGNERTMLLQRLSNERPEQYAAYRAMLEERAEQLGLDPAEIKGMKRPVLVRELTEAPADDAALREMNRRSDVPVGKDKDPISDASTRAARMRDAKDSLAHLTDPEKGLKVAEGETLRAYLASPRGRAYVDQLVKDRVIEPSELAKFRDPQTGALTEAGIDTIERTMEAAAVGSPEVASLARANVPTILNKLEHAFPALVRASNTEGWSVAERLQEALRLHIQAKDVPGGKLEDLLSQGSLLGEEHSAEAVSLARFLERSSKGDIKLAAHRYAEQGALAGRMNQSDDLFGAKPPSPDQAFNDTFGRSVEKPKGKPATPPKRDGGFATAMALRPIVGAGVGALYGGGQGETYDEHIRNAALYAALGAGVSLAPEVVSKLFGARAKSELGVAAARVLQKIGLRGADYIERVGGDAGRFLADDIRQIDMRSTFRFGAQADDAAKALEGLTPDEVRLAKKVADSRSSATGAPKHVKDAGEELRRILDRDKDDAVAVGIQTSGKSGHAYPQIPTKDAIEALEALKTIGTSDVRVQKLAQAMIDDGLAKDMAEAVDKLEAYQAIRDGRGSGRTPKVGMNPYLESKRFQLPEDYVDWDNNAAFRSALRRNATTIESARQWGPRHEATNIYIDAISKHAGSDVGTDVEGFLSHDFGGVTRADKATTKIVGAISNYETATKLGNFLSPVLNYGQQFANLSHLPLKAQYQAFKAYPPLIGRFLKEGADLRAWAERSGVVYGHTAMADVPTGASGKLTDALLSGFVKAAKSNEIRTAIASRFALENDIEHLMKVAPTKTAGLRGFLDALGEKGVAGAPVRRLDKMGVDTGKLADILSSGRRLTPGELNQAAYHLVHDTQFPMTVASKPIWWSRSPVARLAAKFKPFGMRQTQYIYENVLKEAGRGNVAPLAKFVATATLTGEMYHIARDLVLGSDKSVTVHAAKNEGDLSGVGHRMMMNFVAQGGLGLIWDLQYGLSNWLGGPVVSTFKNIADAAPAMRQAVSAGRYGQAATTALEFAKNEAPGARQAAAMFDRIKAKVTGDSPYIPYADLRNDAARKASAGKSVGEDLGGAFDEMLRGQAEFETTINTIPYRSAASAIQAGDPAKAAEHIAIILRSADDLSQAIGSARATMTRRGPLGGLSDQQKKDYLASLDPAEREAAVKLNMRWRQDSERAIQAAVTKARAK